ncbi:MAG: hypothetical protein [Bacteriophage sp.]|nr:MAG: hypothetical protein [Bacteriophage sp.]
MKKKAVYFWCTEYKAYCLITVTYLGNGERHVSYMYSDDEVLMSYLGRFVSATNGLLIAAQGNTPHNHWRL